MPIKNTPPTSANELRRSESVKSATFVAFCVCCCTGEYYIKRFAQSGAFLLAPSASSKIARENKHRERGVRADIEGNLCGECWYTMGWRIATWDNGVLVLSAPIINTLSGLVVFVWFITPWWAISDVLLCYFTLLASFHVSNCVLIAVEWYGQKPLFTSKLRIPLKKIRRTKSFFSKLIYIIIHFMKNLLFYVILETKKWYTFWHVKFVFRGL